MPFLLSNQQHKNTEGVHVTCIIYCVTQQAVNVKGPNSLYITTYRETQTAVVYNLKWHTDWH